LLSKKGNEGLRGFLKAVLILNENELSVEDKKKLEKLIEEVVQPQQLKTLTKNQYYVIYRCQRTFTSSAFNPTDDLYIAESHLAYIDCDEEDKAYFYAAVLNYLAYKAIKLKRPFVRDQFARPIKALIGAELTWRNFIEREPKSLSTIVKLSKILHNKVPKMFGNKKYRQERTAFKDLEGVNEFKKLVIILDSYVQKYVGKEQLEDALSWVTGGS